MIAVVAGVLLPQNAAAEFGFLAHFEGHPGTGAGQFAPILGSPSLATDSAGSVYAVDEDNGRVHKFSPTLALSGGWGRLNREVIASGSGEFNNPTAVAVGPDDSVYVLDTFRDPAVQKFSASGAFLAQFASNAPPYETTGRGEVDRPISITVDGSGKVFVLELGRIVVFGPDGKRIAAWGEFGFGPGQFAPHERLPGLPIGGPLGIAADKAGNVYVADTFGSRVHKFTGAGGFLETWRGPEDRPYFTPTNVAADPAGGVYVTESDRVHKLDANMRPIDRFGIEPSYGDPDRGARDGEFSLADGVAADHGGNVYVADSPYPLAARIQKFGPGGVRPPGTILPTAKSRIAMTLAPVSKGVCPVRLRRGKAQWRDCRSLRMAQLKWSVRCPPSATSGWGVALRSTPRKAGVDDASYRPIDFRGPKFRPKPPMLTDGQWLLPDGTDLGERDPKTTNVLTYAGGLPAHANGRQTAVLSPGLRVYPTMIGACGFGVSNGALESSSTEVNGPVALVRPGIAREALRSLRGRRLKPTELRSGRAFRVSVGVAYDGRSLRALDENLFIIVRGAGVRFTLQRGAGVRFTRQRLTFTVKPKRPGWLVITGEVAGVRTSNRLTLRIQ